MTQDHLTALHRYIDEYHWSFNLAKRLINIRFGTEYTEKELKKAYKVDR